MELIKVNTEKSRAVYRLPNGNFIKYWHLGTYEWLEQHVNIVRTLMPGYIVDYGINELGIWIETYPLPGTPANTFPHTKEFMLRIYNFCCKTNSDTKPYVHGDWVLSNMIIDGDSIRFCDWDNVGIYPEDEVNNKLINDLTSAFGKEFEDMLNDTTSV